MRRMQGRGFASVWGFLALILVAGAAWALASWGLPEGAQVWLSSDTGVAQLGVSPDGTMALSTLLAGGGWLTTDAASGGLWLLNGQDHLVALGPDGAVGKPLDLAPALGSAQPLGFAVDGAADAAWVVTPDQLTTVALGSAQVQRTQLPAGVVAWAQDAAQHTLWLASDHRLTEYDAHGQAMTSFALPEVLTAMAYDTGSGQIWMAFANNQVARYTPSGQQTLQAPRPTMATGPMVADGAGGLWIAGRTHVVHLDAEGFVRVRTAVMAETDASAVSMPAAGIQALAVDPISHGAWVKTPTALVALDAAGRIVQSVPMNGPMSAGTFRSLVLRAVPPTGPPANPSPVQPTPPGGIHTPAIANTPANSSTNLTSNTAQDARSAALQPCTRGSSASTCAPITAGAPSHPPARILWVAAGHDLYQLLPPASSAQALDRLPRPQTVAVDPTDGALWAYRHGQLWSVSPAGVVTVDVKLAEQHDDDHRAYVAIDGTHAIVWLAVGRTLTRLDTTGKILGTIPLKHGANGISLDTATGQLWVAEHHELEAFNSSGSLFVDTTVQGAVRALDADADLDAVWVATQRDLLRLSATGQVQLTVKMHGNADRRMAADGQGGLWIAGGSTLRHVSQTGVVGFALQPLVPDHDATGRGHRARWWFSSSEGGAIRALAADPLTHAVWVEGRHHLVEESLTQQPLAVIDSRTWSRIDESETHADHDDTQRHALGPMALYVDTIPPVLTLVAPPVGTYTNKPQLPLSFSYSDVGSGVDPSTLTIQNTATGQPLVVSCQTTASTAICTPTSPLADGNYTLSATVQDYAGNTSKPVALQFTIDTVPPTITITSPTRTLTNQPNLTLAGTLSKIATLTVNGQAVTVNGALQFSLPITLTEGTNTYTLVATDRAGNVATTTLTITLDTVPPPPPDLGLFNVAGPVNGQVTVTGQAGSVQGGDTVTLTDTVTGATVTVTANADGSFTATLAAGAADPISVSVADPAGNVTQAPTTIEASNLPPSPSSEAPTLPPTEQAPFVEQVSFLYSGSNPIQTGVAPGTIQPLRVAVVRGQVLDRANQPLSGVTVSVLGHPEYGQTLTRASGWFDLAVNGGGAVVLNFTKAGYLMAQRTVNVPWGNFAIAQPLVMITPDPVATPVTFGSAATSMQVAQSSVQVGQSGTRQTTVFIPAGTTATEELPNGTSQQLTTAHLRATEFTVGANGPQAMPAALPATSAYTYAVDLSLDEAQSAGATTVQFSQPVPVYVNNYLGIPIGTAVPAGWYDPTVGAWKGSTDGVVLKFLGVDASGDAEVDLTGSGTPATATQLSAYGITTAELAQIAKTFTPGQSFWRVLVPHFTYWDFNYGYNPLANFALPPAPPGQPLPPPRQPTSHDHKCTGCEVDAENQRVGITVPVVGTPYALHFESRQKPVNTITFPVTTANPPGDTLLKTIEVRVFIAGRQIIQDFDPSIPNQTFTWTWNGKNAFGQPVYTNAQPQNDLASGPVPTAENVAEVTLAYEYKESYGAFIGGTPGADQTFAQPANTVMVGFAHAYSNTSLVAATRRWYVRLSGAYELPPLGVRGWGLSILDRYDFSSQTLTTGTGGIRSGIELNSGYVANNFAGDGQYPDPGLSGVGALSYTPLGYPAMVQIAPDGSAYIWDADEGCIIKSFAGEEDAPFAGHCGVSGPSMTPANYTRAPQIATSLPLDSVLAMASDSEGGIYVATQGEIVYLSASGYATLVAGGGAQPPTSWANDNAVNFSCIDSLGVSPNGSLWFICNHQTVWRLDQSGLLQQQYATNSGTVLNSLAISGNGSVYIVGNNNFNGGFVQKVLPNGAIEAIAGTTFGAASATPLSIIQNPATQVTLGSVTDILSGPHGNLYGFIAFPDVEWFKLSQAGSIACIINCNNQDSFSTHFNGNGTSADDLGPFNIQVGSYLSAYEEAAIGPDGTLYLPDVANFRILALSSTFPSVSTGEFFVSSRSGRSADEFNALGQEVARYDTATWAPVLRFAYDSAGFLTSITDASGNATTIQRDSSENPVSISSPFGQVTKLTSNSSQELTAITDPAGDAWQFKYDVNAYLVDSIDPRGEVDQYSYGPNGDLISDVEPNGGGWTLSHTPIGNYYYSPYPYTINMVSGAGRKYSFALSDSDNGVEDTETLPDGLKTTDLYMPTGWIQETRPSGTTVLEQMSPDPRFGAESLYPAQATITLPGGQTATETESRAASSVDLGTPGQLQWSVSRPAGLGPSTSELFDPSTMTWTDAINGVFTTIAVDSLDRPVSIALPGSGIAPITMIYTPQGQIASMTQASVAASHVETFHYYTSGPSAGLLESETDPAGLTTSYQYDPDGRVVREVLPDGSAVGFSYDAVGNLTAVAPPGEPAHDFTYNAVNQTASDTSPTVTGSAPLAFHYTYNLDRQLTGIAYPDGTTVSMNYDGGGRLSQVSLPGLGAYSYVYDASTGQLSSITAPDNETLNESWDGFLNTQTQWSGAISGTVARSFDSNLQLSAISVNGASTQQYTYDSNGRLALAGTSAGTLGVGRDPASGRVVSTVYPGAPFPTAVTTNATASAIRTTAVKSHTAVPEVVVCGSGCGGGGTPPPSTTTVSTARQYDPFGDVSQLSATSYGALVYQGTFTRDADGRITQDVEDLNGTTTTWGYTYDSRGRLSTVSENGSVLDTYGYDANGNRISVNGQTVANYNADDQLTSYNGVPYTYAADGSLASAGSTTYQYDALGHLLEVKTPTETITYTYDGLGRRVGKSVNGTLVQGFLYADGLHPIAELDGQGNVVATFVYGTRPNVPDLMIKGGMTYRIISDPLGSPVEVINTATGAVVEQITYDAWGTITSDTNPGFQPFGFAGGLYDADTGLVHFGARDYDPAIGRWTTRDPLGFAGGDTNLYGYVLQDPINLEDPAGLRWVTVEVNTPGGSDWLMATYNYISDEIGNGMQPKVPYSDPHNETGTIRYVIQKWESPKICSGSKHKNGELRKIKQTFINGPDAWAKGGRSYHWYPPVPTPTNESMQQIMANGGQLN